MISFKMCYIFLETFPNPMKMVPSASLPNLKVQRLNVMNKLSSMKGSCIATSSNDGTEQSGTEHHENHEPEHLERRTIDSKHISTVSSLVATRSDDDDPDKSSKAKESQRNNFGLYALKFHRNLATHANTMFVNFKKDIGKRSKVSSKSADEPPVSESPEFDAARGNRSKHEYFEPCHRQRTHRNGNEAHYDSEFDDCRQTNAWNNSNRFQRNRCENDSDDAINGPPNSRAPVRPRRIKPVAPKAKPVAAAHRADARNSFARSIESIDSYGSDENVMNI